jgi:hypothetical protein
VVRVKDRAVLPALGLTIPAIVWLAAAAALLVASLGGYRALAAPADVTMSEAAALRDEAEVLRQIRHGVDPNATQYVRRGAIHDGDYFMTPLEAAIAARHSDVVRLLLRTGAELTSINYPVLLCLAEESDPEIASLLREHASSETPPKCDGVRLPF